MYCHCKYNVTQFSIQTALICGQRLSAGVTYVQWAHGTVTLTIYKCNSILYISKLVLLQDGSLMSYIIKIKTLQHLL